jgi:hypothetical protein|tara:strand:+ start:424 stop:861 length:438 start_codon:yes stop_codon:yes gene_type:complete
MTGVFEGVGTLQFSPDNKYCYAYSGSISPNSNAAPETTALLFTTQSYYSLIKLNWTCSSTSSTVDQFFRILMNDIIIFDSVAEDDETATGQSPLDLIIPPFSKFEIKVGNAATSPFTVLLVGEVKGAIEQENLESITNNNKWASK